MYILALLLTGHSEKFFRKLTGKGEMEDSLLRLDRLTQEEARIASAELLKMAQCTDNRVRGVEGQVKGVRDDVQDVRGDVCNVDDKVQGIDSNVRVVDQKLDQANRSLSIETQIATLRSQKLYREPA